jgi:hypothetical protein
VKGKKSSRPRFSISLVLEKRLANDLGMTDALGGSREGRLALWQVFARTIGQTSRLSATCLAKTHEIDFLE